MTAGFIRCLYRCTTMKLNQVLTLSLLFSFLLLAFTGCARVDGPERVLVSGKVAYGGQPIQDGRIRFIPVSGTSSPAMPTFIQNGQYNTAEVGGIVVGSYRVEILAYDPTELANRSPGFGQPPPRQILPTKFNKESQLSLELVSGTGQLEHDFILKK